MFERQLPVITRLCLLGLFLTAGCGNRQSKVIAATPPIKPVAVPLMMLVTTAPATRTYISKPPAIKFDYPGDWIPDKAQTAVFAIKSPQSAAYSSLSLDIPKLPWHLPGMITLNMVANGYEDDLKKNQIHDAVVKEKCPVTVCGTKACRLTSVGTEYGHVSIDVAIIMIHADQVYILSADSDQAGCDTARKALDSAVMSLKW